MTANSDRERELTEIDDALRGEMNLSQVDIPRSTIAAAVALWGVLAALMTWNLSMTATLVARQERADEALKATNARVDDVKRQTDRNTDDIRDIQRAMK